MFPPGLRANGPSPTRSSCSTRAHECERKRGMPVNMIAVDYYERGALLDVVSKLNG